MQYVPALRRQASRAPSRMTSSSRSEYFGIAAVDTIDWEQ
jgi:hypothetical protein